MCEHFSRLSAGSDEDGAGSDDGAETVSPPSNAKKQRNTKRGRLSQLSSAWCCAFTNSRSEAWLVAVSDVAAVVLNSSTVPEECIVDCPRTDLVAETKSYFDSTKLELKKLAREPTHDVTFNDVVSHLKRIPANDRRSSLLRIWVKAFRIEEAPFEYVVCCALGQLQATIRVDANLGAVPMPWYEPQVWSYWCDFKFKYYLLWTHILPLLAHLLRRGSQTIEVANKLLKKTIKDVAKIKRKGGIHMKLSEYVAVRCPLFLAEQLQYIERGREAATWAHRFGLVASPVELAPLIASIGGTEPQQRKTFESSDFGPRGSVRMEPEVRRVQCWLSVD